MQVLSCGGVSAEPLFSESVLGLFMVGFSAGDLSHLSSLTPWILAIKMLF